MLGIGKEIPAASYAAASVVAAAIGSYCTAQVSFDLSMQHIRGSACCRVSFTGIPVKRGALACVASVGWDSVFSRWVLFIDNFLEGASAAAGSGDLWATGGQGKSGCGRSRLSLLVPHAAGMQAGWPFAASCLSPDFTQRVASLRGGLEAG
ncbi:MAG: hypothetical protein ACPIOQ_15075 [Promethearchaeia archaeon]